MTSTPKTTKPALDSFRLPEQAEALIWPHHARTGPRLRIRPRPAVPVGAARTSYAHPNGEALCLDPMRGTPKKTTMGAHAPPSKRARPRDTSRPFECP